MEWKSAESNKETGLTKIPKRWLHIHYYEALNILFRFENSLRVIVYAVLKKERGLQWPDSNFQLAGQAQQQSIGATAARRISQASTFGYVGFDIQAPLMHLTSGELIELLTSETYWPHFKPHMKASKEIIKNKLLEVGSIRNSLAHFRPIRADDIEVIKQSSKHALVGVESCLKNIFAQTLRVPTNSTDAWYAGIAAITSKFCGITMFYSENEEWVKVAIEYRVPIIEKKFIFEGYYTYKVSTLNTPNVLTFFSDLRQYVTSSTEHVSYPILNERYDIRIQKDLYFVFPRTVLAANHESIRAALAALVEKIDSETELLLKDNLARGDIVEVADVTAWYRKPEKEGENGSWQYHYVSLSRPYRSGDPDEYWGTPLSAGDPVGSLIRYPWMPEDISETDAWWED